MKPIVRWAGSKRQLVPHLAPFWLASGARRYVEPFAGSAALCCEIEPGRALLGDRNRELIAMYRAVRRNPDAVSAALQRWRGSAQQYYRIRGLLPEELAPEVRAARFLYLNRWCFNGLYRTNRSGLFNVPFGGLRTPPPVTREHLSQFSLFLRKATLISDDFSETLVRVKAGDFVYLDPPYSVRDRRVFSDYGPDGFGPSDLVRLRRWLDDLDALGAKFLLSYADSDEADALAAGFNTARIAVTRNVGGFRSRRRRATEVLAWNFTYRQLDDHFTQPSESRGHAGEN